MIDLRDEPTSVVVDTVTRKGPAQLRNSERVDVAARFFLRADVREPPAVTSNEGPHGYRRGRARLRPATSRVMPSHRRATIRVTHNMIAPYLTTVRPARCG